MLIENYILSVKGGFPYQLNGKSDFALRRVTDTMAVLCVRHRGCYDVFSVKGGFPYQLNGKSDFALRRVTDTMAVLCVRHRGCYDVFSVKGGFPKYGK